MKSVLFFAIAVPLLAADQPQFGRAWDRNMVSAERGLVESFDPATKANIKWIADIGTETHGTPIVAGGRVYISTNNGQPRNAESTADAGVLMCFSEKDGSFLWQLASPKLSAEDPYLDWPKTGMSSPPTIAGDRIYVVTNRAQVLCLDARDPNKPPLWTFDMPSGAGIYPHDGAHSSILIHGQHLYLNTGTGVDNTHRKIRTPDAPSLIVLEKETGKYVARADEKIAPNIFHATWSAPSLGTVAGREMIYFCGGNGITYAFEPLPQTEPAAQLVALKKLWQYDIDPEGPKTEVHRFTQNKSEGPSNIYGMPVFADGKLYVAGGGDLFWGKNKAWLKCLDAADGKELWSYELNKHVVSTAAVVDGLVFIADIGRTIHCVEAATGKGVWTEPGPKGDFWASPMVADGKLYIGSRKGDFWIMAAGREKKVLSTLQLGAGISGTATAANGVLFIATMKQLIAVGK